MSGCSLWIKRFYRESLILVLCSFILVHLLLDHPDKLDEVTTLKNFNVALPSFLQQHRESAPEPEPAVKSLNEISDDLSTISDDDPKLLNYLRTQKMTYPDYSVDRHIGEPELGQIGQVKEILKYFNNKQNGVFFEAGAFNGEYLSNTVYLEAKLNWTGLLVEPNTKAYEGLLSKKRKSHSINSCLSLTNHPDLVTFDSADVYGGIDVHLDNAKNSDLKRMRDSVKGDMRFKTQTECFPLYTLLVAVGIEKKLDFLSLDIEGAELKVLSTIPWDKVDIELLMIEVNHIDNKELEKIMKKAGYAYVKTLGGLDKIYKKIR